MIKFFKLYTNELVISEYEEGEDVFDLIKPAMVVPDARGLGICPFPTLCSTKMDEFKDMVLPKKVVAYSYEPDNEILEMYKTAISKIITPTSSIIA